MPWVRDEESFLLLTNCISHFLCLEGQSSLSQLLWNSTQSTTSSMKSLQIEGSFSHCQIPTVHNFYLIFCPMYLPTVWAVSSLKAGPSVTLVICLFFSNLAAG